MLSARFSAAGGLAAIAVALLLTACHDASSPTPGPEARCASACATRAPSCGEEQCARGCRLVLDKMIEHEGAHVVACVAKAKTCDDQSFARCAVLTGPHADGGPPPPTKYEGFDPGADDSDSNGDDL